MAVRRIEVRERAMEQNDQLAALVRRRLEDADVSALNLMSSPGAGKTLLLERTVAYFGPSLRISTVVGDLQTQNDRLARRTDRLAQAVVTNGARHLDARHILAALDALDLSDTDLLFIENDGNLVCPASRNLGETANVVLSSVTEGEDKPLKCPKMFQRARYAVLTKVDLLPNVDFDLAKAVAFLREVNPSIEILLTSARDGTGLGEWYDLLRSFARRSAWPTLASS